MVRSHDNAYWENTRSTGMGGRMTKAATQQKTTDKGIDRVF